VTVGLKRTVWCFDDARAEVRSSDGVTVATGASCAGRGCGAVLSDANRLVCAKDGRTGELNASVDAVDM
jgi:hypothetical protein